MSDPAPLFYKGWRLLDHGPDYHPVTGRWRAAQYGVEMGHPTKEGLLRMIDTKEQDRWNWTTPQTKGAE